jgi:tetratricopeptide (TPR) repeat protein
VIPVRQRSLSWLVLASTLVATPAFAMRFWPFADDAQRLVQEARVARQRLDFASAASLLDDAINQDPHLEAEVLHERGLLARDRGDLEHALTLLKRAADADATLAARVDQAGVLVQLGRWPEAVVVLRQAFDERGTSLSVEQVTSDKRFVKLAALKPYQEVVEGARSEQSGPFGRVLVRLERLQASATAAEHGLDRLALWLGFVREIATDQMALVAMLVALGLFFTFGASQLGLFGAPWTLLLGMGAASVLWATGAHAVTHGQSWGRDTVILSLLSVLGVWSVGAGCRWAWRRYRLSRLGAGDPFTPEHLADTLMLVDEVSRLGHRVLTSGQREQKVLAEALRQAGETLRERLDKGAGQAS